MRPLFDKALRVLLAGWVSGMAIAFNYACDCSVLDETLLYF